MAWDEKMSDPGRVPETDNPAELDPALLTPSIMLIFELLECYISPLKSVFGSWLRTAAGVDWNRRQQMSGAQPTPKSLFSLLLVSWYR